MRAYRPLSVLLALALVGLAVSIATAAHRVGRPTVAIPEFVWGRLFWTLAFGLPALALLVGSIVWHQVTVMTSHIVLVAVGASYAFVGIIVAIDTNTSYNLVARSIALACAQAMILLAGPPDPPDVVQDGQTLDQAGEPAGRLW